MLDVWRDGAGLALTRRFDVVIVSKPRLPGLVLGLMLAEQSRCPIIFDFDEDERSFVSHEVDDPATAAAKLLSEPFGAAGTALAAHYWSMADAVTVASPILQARLGGHLVRHARDETAPLPNRNAARHRLGYAPDDLVLAFVGTARAHKGLDRVLAAMTSLADRRIKLMVVGNVADPGLARMLSQSDPAQVTVHGECDMASLGTYLAAADLVPLLQDQGNAVSQWQFPAKLTDALQHGIKVVATATPPLKEIGMTEAVDLIAQDGLAAYLLDRLREGGPVGRPAQIRRIFEDEFSLAVNRVRLFAAVAEATSRSNPFARTVPDALRALADNTRRARAAAIPESVPSAPAVHAARRDFDVVMFWKQNDSGLFGRRPDMIAKYLLRSGRVRRIVHFDRPVRPSDLRRMALASLHDVNSVSSMQFPATVGRRLQMADDPAFIRRVFMSRQEDAAPSFAGQELPASAALADFVSATLREAAFDADRTLAWVCPVVRNFAAIDRKLAFRWVVADLIDDERSGSISSDQLHQIQAEYEHTLSRADLVLANAAGNRDRFAALRTDIHIVPNGAELTPPPPGLPVPGFVAQLRHPTIGYIGNLRDRIDWPMLLSLARVRPGWDIVLIGPWETRTVPDDVMTLKNIKLTGPLSYEIGRSCLRSFDCAIMPHTRDAMTDAMNPLKIYNYLAAGLPIVATPVANLHGVQDMVSLAEGVGDFVAAIEAALRAREAGCRPDLERLQPLSWASRVDRILLLLDGLEAGTVPPPEFV
jgi:glycosyltransferase involved in cell wall biosynthesis